MTVTTETDRKADGVKGALSSRVVKVNGANIYVETVGKGPAILLMHGGFGLSHNYLRPYFDQLSTNFQVIYYDHFGNGKSDKPDDYRVMTFERLASDADQLMTALGHDRFTLIGHSCGGFIAQEFVIRYADRLDGLVLVDTAPALDFELHVSGSDVQLAALDKLFSQPMADDTEWRSTWNTVLRMYFHQWSEEVGADLDARTDYEHRAWNASGDLFYTFNAVGRLGAVATPTLVISGRHDGITPPDSGAERIAAEMPNAELSIFGESGHYPFIEESDAFFDKLNTWLSR
ncbi:alpha/beta fold hydrolase [Epibacterium sp. Ofav1-8]|uniref:alpha/beta fold hydrolase n=1 Tax=Epibacterium sp. Ofav1-8 TaxID=2917735 RepID=UPI001EF71A92|nr:alpha/beta fold hydrolase [Epibacterium sp. Ofav1-8]MCG7625172.1 alpha/beta fold hydrolase [Epibacterium sp. Ofav1-8]